MTALMIETAPAVDRRARRAGHADWVRLTVATLARVVLFSVVGGVIWAALPTVWGWRATTVMSDSMAPGIRAGDVVVSIPSTTSGLQLGRVILLHDPDHPGTLRLHRYVAVTDTGQLITRGDANAQNDSTPVLPDQVVGVGFLRAPFVGLPLLWASEGKNAWVAAAGVALLGLAFLSTVDAHLRRRRIEDGRTRGRQRRRGTRALAVGAGGLLLAAALSAQAHAAFATMAPNTGNSLAAASAYPCLTVTPTDSPYLYYAFTESSGTTATDSSGNSRTGALQTGATRNVGSCVAGASPSLTLNGTTSGQVVTPSTLITNPTTYSLQVWFKTTSTTGGKLLGFGNSQSGSSTSYDRHLYLDNAGQVVFGVRTGGVVTIVSPTSYNNGAWHHVVATMDATFAGMRLYVDGTLVGSNANKVSQNYNGYWRIGHDNLANWGITTPTSYAFTGAIDNVAVYTTALTATQVSAHYAGGH